MLKLRKNWRWTMLIAVAVLALMLINPSPGAVEATIAPKPLTFKLAQASTPGLRVQDNQLVDTAGNRFVVAGVNMEMFRDYDGGCGWVTDGSYAIRGIMADRVKNLGVNAVRLNFSYRFLNTANLTKFLDMAQELASRGIYVMPSDHTYTGNSLINASSAYPMMYQIVTGMRARGLENYLIMNPYNEPGPGISNADWVAAQKNVLINIRTTAGFKGVVVLDGTGWSTQLDVNSFRQVMAYDATINGGTPNLVFSNHLYPNITALPAQIWAAANQVPLLIGELGQENPGASALDPQYVKNVLAGELNAGIPNGHNGAFAWIWAWCDSNNLLQDWTDASVPYTANSPLTSHGVLWRDNYFSKVPTSAPVPTIIAQQPTATNTPLVPPPTAIVQPSATPTRSVIPTNTPRPRSATPTLGVIIVTNTPRPPSVTPLATAVPTQVPTGTEIWRVTGKVGGWDVDLTFQRVK